MKFILIFLWGLAFTCMVNARPAESERLAKKYDQYMLLKSKEKPKLYYTYELIPSQVAVWSDDSTNTESSGSRIYSVVIKILAGVNNG